MTDAEILDAINNASANVARNFADSLASLDQRMTELTRGTALRFEGVDESIDELVRQRTASDDVDALVSAPGDPVLVVTVEQMACKICRGAGHEALFQDVEAYEKHMEQGQHPAKEQERERY